VGLASDDINPGYRMWANGLSAHVPITTPWIMSEDARPMTGPNIERRLSAATVFVKARRELPGHSINK
jgi:hypothetical protein